MNAADGASVIVDDHACRVEEVRSGVPADPLGQDGHRIRSPHVVAEQDRDEVGAGHAHAGVEGAGELASLVDGDGDALAGRVFGEPSLDARAFGRLDDHDQLPPRRGLLQERGDRGGEQVVVPALQRHQSGHDSATTVRIEMASVTFHRIAESRAREFTVKGYRSRDVFAHRLYHLPKCGPDGYKVAGRMAGDFDLGHHWQVLLFAEPELVAQFPRELFFDDDVMWHRQHLGMPGQVASVSILLDGGEATSMVHQSDLVQRIARAPAQRSRIDNRFKGWPSMLLNAIIGFAAQRGATRVRTPTAELAMEHTDPARNVGRDLFDRVYDRPAERMGATRANRWWVHDIALCRHRVVLPDRVSEHLPEERVIAVAHDLERGHGHRDVDPELAEHADSTADGTLADMLAIEARLGVRATYNVVGCFLDEVRDALEADHHCVAFHSFDHRLESEPGASGDQLGACRAIDERVKGYRPPRSVITSDCRDEQLAFHNFEWLANSAYASNRSMPEVQNRIVQLPVTVDDFALHTGDVGYETWERQVLERAAAQMYSCVSLHDCYAPLWLPQYARLLDRLAELGELRTLDAVAATQLLRAAA